MSAADDHADADEDAVEDAFGAERAAAFLLARVRAQRGRLWDEGARAGAPLPASAAGGALQIFATRRVRGVSPVVADALLAWARGQRPVELVSQILSPRALLRRQAQGRRCVALVDDEAARAHGDPRHPDGLSFALHDLRHLEKFVAPEHHRGQVGFFRAVDGALATAEVAALEATFDATWGAERDYVIADMNGSAVFLFSVLKMRLAMAVRRRLAAAQACAAPAPRAAPAPCATPDARVAPSTGGLTPLEHAALLPVLEVWFAGMGLPSALRSEALAVSARRDHPAHARRLLDHFEQVGGA